ncbi:hypothetical protein J2T49_001289 [Pseudomonas nitroreducens]|nr:hypothetical protein [Pseudomonas nitroreducens]MCP1685350.1 hypothetical protein [Pseudomonas nitroreducens]
MKGILGTTAAADNPGFPRVQGQMVSGWMVVV